ncbi:MAG: 4-(cytidine 5'-diphospho)-2-C-methyl-D-erythritol kinase [Bacteroidia bacterium]
MITFSNSKINIGLHIYDKLSNGYHNIESIFYPINWSDTIEIIPNKIGLVNYTQYGLKIDGSIDANLIVKAYNLLKADFNIGGADIYHLKNIPMGAGLGGGSANATYTLMLCNKIFNLGLNQNQLKIYASKLGSDCVFFIENKPAYVFGTGTETETIDLNLNEFFIVIVKPLFHVSTKEAYENAHKRGIKSNEILLKDLVKKPIKEWKNFLFNDFENYVFKKFPMVEEIKNKLYKNGALYASMSGSGSAVYGIFNEIVDLKNEFKDIAYFSNYLSIKSYI